MEQEELDRFVSSLIAEKHIEGITPEGRARVAQEIKEQLVEQINRAVLDRLPDEKLDELNRLMDAGNFGAEDMQNFINNSGVDIPKVTAETLLYFRSFYLGKTGNQA